MAEEGGGGGGGWGRRRQRPADEMGGGLPTLVPGGRAGGACGRTCGSMQSGQRLARTVRMPFWMLSSSLGSPSDAQPVVSTSLVSSASSRKGCVSGTARAAASPCHISYTIAWR